VRGRLIRPGSGKALAKMWDTRAKEANQSSKRNIFSKHYDPSAPKLGRGQEGYGKAPAGSKSAERAERAKEWVKEQIGLLIATIIKIGTKDPEGNHEVCSNLSLLRLHLERFGKFILNNH